MTGENTRDEEIRMIYANRIQKEQREDPINLRKEKEILEVLRTFEEKLDRKQYIEVRDKAFLIALIGEESGFVKGMRYAFRLYQECIYE